MADFEQFYIDLETERAGSEPGQVRKGEAPRTAFSKLNDFMEQMVQLVQHVGNVEPHPVKPYQFWTDTSQVPARMMRRNADNTAWEDYGAPYGANGPLAIIRDDSTDLEKQAARDILQLGLLATIVDTSSNAVKKAARELLQIEYAGSTPPVSPGPYMVWIDTSGSEEILRRRNGANSGWVEIGPVFP